VTAYAGRGRSGFDGPQGSFTYDADTGIGLHATATLVSEIGSGQALADSVDPNSIASLRSAAQADLVAEAKAMYADDKAKLDSGQLTNGGGARVDANLSGAFYLYRDTVTLGAPQAVQNDE